MRFQVTLGVLTTLVVVGSAGQGQPARIDQDRAVGTDSQLTAGRSVVSVGQRPHSKPDYSVAPVFVHGEGRGVIGCAAVLPPVLLSEAEALDVIREELMGEDLGFEARGRRIEGLSLERPALGTHPGRGGRRPRPRAVAPLPPFFHAYSARHRCGVLFVGHRNYRELENPSPSQGTVEKIDTLGLAQKLAERLRIRPTSHAAVFYDPLVPNRGIGDSDPRQEAKRLLREQVEEFVVWLEGISP